MAEFLNQPFVVFILGGAAAGLVAWGSARTEIRFLWRDQNTIRQAHKELELRVNFLERRTFPSRRKQHGVG